jgi:hypothetical protein
MQKDPEPREHSAGMLRRQGRICSFLSLASAHAHREDSWQMDERPNRVGLDSTRLASSEQPMHKSTGDLPFTVRLFKRLNTYTIVLHPSFSGNSGYPIGYRIGFPNRISITCPNVSSPFTSLFVAHIRHIIFATSTSHCAASSPCTNRSGCL